MKFKLWTEAEVDCEILTEAETEFVWTQAELELRVYLSFVIRIFYVELNLDSLVTSDELNLKLHSFNLRMKPEPKFDHTGQKWGWKWRIAEKLILDLNLQLKSKVEKPLM